MGWRFTTSFWAEKKQEIFFQISCSVCLLISVGCIYPANYAEQKINEAYDTILRADKVTAEMIPALCDYVIFSENGEKIGGDLSEQYEQIAWNVAKHGNASGKYFYKVIVRENEYVVLQYRLTPQYHSAFLREHFIGPQNVMIIMSVIGAVAIIIIQSILFWRSGTDLDVYHDYNSADLFLYQRCWNISRCGRNDHAFIPCF